MSKRKARQAFGVRVNQCSLCDEFLLTVGQQTVGGVRYCKDCITHTLAWVQMTQEDREAVVGLFARLETQPVVQTALEAGKTLTAEEKKAHSINESGYRLMMSMREESR